MPLPILEFWERFLQEIPHRRLLGFLDISLMELIARPVESRQVHHRGHRPATTEVTAMVALFSATRSPYPIAAAAMSATRTSHSNFLMWPKL